MATRLYSPGAEDVLYLVDLSGYVFRAYHAVAPLSSPSGEPTHAVFGTVNMLERLIRQCRPALLAVAMDSKGKTFRSELFPGYKAHRPPPPPDLSQQMQRVAEVVAAFGVPIFQRDGVEADDLIATVVRLARERSLRVVVVSADKDLMQLVEPDQVVLWDSMRDRVFGAPEVEERYSVGPGQMRDLLALMGDTSDNVPGVPSVGPKTAAELLRQHGSLEGVYQALDAIPRKKLREVLRAHEADARLSQRLVTLASDLPIRLDLEALRFGGRDLAKLKALYLELGFTRLLTLLESSPLGAERAPDAVTPAAGAPLDAAITSAERPGEVACLHGLGDLEALVEEARRSGRLGGFALTTESQGALAPLVGLGLCPSPGRARYLPWRDTGSLTRAQATRALLPLLGDARIAKLGWDTKRDRVALSGAGLPLEGVTFDAGLAAYLLTPESPRSLELLAEQELGWTLPPVTALLKPSRGVLLHLAELPTEAAALLAAPRAELALHLESRLGPRLAEARLRGLLDEVELPLAALLAELELRGVLVDTQQLVRLGKRIEQELLLLEQRAHRIAGRDFNTGSPRQLEAILFDELGLKPLKRTKTARSTDAATLEALADEHELPGVILELRQLSKLKSTYTDTLPQQVDPHTGRIHTRWEQTVAATGRLSSLEPNLQNIPIRSELGRAIRGAFIAPPGHVIMSADYSQIELRVLAHLSRDPVLMDAFQRGQDVHARTAMEIFEVPADQVTPELRRRAKAVNFGVIYGQGDAGLSKSLGIGRLEAASFIAAYFRRHEGVRRFMDETLEAARASEQVHTLLGRRRGVPDIKSANRALRLAAERVAMNMPIQGTAADVLKLAMLALRTPPSPGARMVLTVHDELVFEVPEAEIQGAEPAIRAAMQGAAELSVPLVVDVRHGPSWSEAH